MGYLRLVRSGASAAPAGTDCLEAFDRELDYVYVLLQRFGARPFEVEDLLQEVFLVLHRHWPTLDTSRPLRPWLFSVTFRVVRGHQRRRRREVLSDEIVVEDAAPNPEAGLLDEEALALLAAAMEEVPAKRRSVVALHDLEGIEVLEIARRLGMTKFGVYTRLYQGRKELAAAMRRLQRRGVQR